MSKGSGDNNAMSGRRGGVPGGGAGLQTAVLLALLINSFLIAYGLFFLWQEEAPQDHSLQYNRELARELAAFNRRLAGESGVTSSEAVRLALADYDQAVERASFGEELVPVIFDQGRRVQETIFREAERVLQEEILTLINSDGRVGNIVDEAHLYIRVSGDGVVVYPDRFLEPVTMKRIQGLLQPDYLHGSRQIDVIIEGGRARLDSTGAPDEQLQALSEDLHNLRQQLYQVMVSAGLAEMVGPGLTLYVYDAQDAGFQDPLVHDADIRDIVNELYSAGAEGISVGGQRLTATSAIRCSGPLIMVNYRQISTDPVVIEAVGDPELLISGLKIIRREMESGRGLSFEISHSGFIKLPASPGGEEAD